MKLSEYRKISSAVSADLKATLAKHGLKMGKERAVIDELNGTVRFAIECADVNLKDVFGNASNPEREFYKNNCRYVEMKAEWLDKPYRTNGREYRVVGMRNTRSPKCVLITRSDAPDKKFICTPEDVIRAFAFAEMTEASKLKLVDRPKSNAA